MPGKPSDYKIHVFRVKKPIEVDTSNATPWFNKGGGGKQYEVESIFKSIDKGQLERMGIK